MVDTLKKVKLNAYVLGSLGGVDIRLFADYEQATGSDGASEKTVTYRGELAQESSLGLLELAGKIGGFDLPTGIPDLLLSDLDIQLVSRKISGSTQSWVESFSFTGKSTLSMGNPFSILGLNVTLTPAESVVFHFALNRYTPSPGANTEAKFSLMLTMSSDTKLRLSSALAWTRDIPGIDQLRELQNDDESEDGADPIALILTPKNAESEDIRIQLVEKSLGTNESATYLKPILPSEIETDSSPESTSETLTEYWKNNWRIDFEFLGYDFEDIVALASKAKQELEELDKELNNRLGKDKNFKFPFLRSSGQDDAKPESKPTTVVSPATPANESNESIASAVDSAPRVARSVVAASDAPPQVETLNRDSADSTSTDATGSKRGGKSSLSQAIVLKRPSVSDIKLAQMDDGGIAISIAFQAILTVGKLRFGLKLPVMFGLGSFAIAIDHERGIEILSAEPELKPVDEKGDPVEDGSFDLFGLEWRFFGAETESGEYSHFKLSTKDFNYQIQQAEGARIEIAYTKASRDPIIFIVEDFAISAKGISLTATVSDRPAQLNGIDTQYRFHGSQIRIVENEILDFTLSGSGPLPPKLVGDAMADISLQFRQEDGNLKLVAGAAKIQGDKLLDCKGTRFQFSIDSMGLQFVNDDRFHIFFTLTGSARFALQDGDDRKNGALSMLPNIQIDLVDCPLTGDASVIAKHISFLIELPKPISFPFLGAYEFELRAIGFLPQFEPFGGDVAMQISGQLKFAQGKGDVANDEPDLHSLFIGLPEPGGFFPRLYMDQLPLDISMGEAFKLNGVVEFKDEDLIKGFEGEGVLEIQGMPPLAASFGFYRVRGSEEEAWVRAWFIYLEVRQVSFRIPVVEFYIREVGLGFGYRYTLVGIKRADEAKNLTQLLQELKVLSRTQGDLSRRDRWALDIEKSGEDPRWTIVFRAMIAQLSAAPTPLTWNAPREEKLACVYLFDAVIAFRSDLTFFMNVRGWINTSYGMYVKERNDGNELEPLFSGFVFLWPRRKRFLAHLASNPNGHLGSNPPLPDFIQSAIRSSQFSATLLIEPGLTHFELGWPNMLRWSNTLGPLEADIRGGFIFRISTSEMVLGISFLARAKLEISSSIDLGFVGATVEAKANAAYGARYIGLVEFATNRPTLYGAIGLELRIKLFVALWIKIPLLFKTIKLNFRFSLDINFTAGLEFAFDGLSNAGLRGSGTLSISAMGHHLQFNVQLSSNPEAVINARERTKKYLNLGLEATEVETTLPGVDENSSDQGSISVASFSGASIEVASSDMSNSDEEPIPTAAFEVMLMEELSPSTEEGQPVVESLEITSVDEIVSDRPKTFNAPNYSVFVIREAHDEYAYFVLFPRSTRDRVGEEHSRPGFLPVPPSQENLMDFKLTFDEGKGLPEGIERFEPTSNEFIAVNDAQVQWRAHWEQPIFSEPEVYDQQTKQADPTPIKLSNYLTHAYLTTVVNDVVEPVCDPEMLETTELSVSDERVQNPSEDAFESAVRGAAEQFRGSPFFKRDPNCTYEKQLEEAFRQDTTIYADSDPGDLNTLNEHQQAHQVRSMVINDLIGDLRKYVDGTEEGDRSTFTQKSVAFQMGLVFRVPKDNINSNGALSWLVRNTKNAPKLQQRTRRDSDLLDNDNLNDDLSVRTFNIEATDFSKYPPQFQRVKHFTDANTIAIAWDLEQNTIPASAQEGLTNLQKDPEHNLMYYEVRRRSLNAQTPEVIYHVKAASVLHRSDDKSLLNILKPRFQVVDHFTDESLDDIIRLPVTGLSYLYSITPYDFGGNAGHPLTLVATRYPNEPPLVPTDGKFTVRYEISNEESAATDLSRPELRQPERCIINWTEPTQAGPRVPVKTHYLIFRKETTLPIGSYGLDSSTQRTRNKLLPTSNSKALPTDIRIELSESQKLTENQHQRQVEITLNDLHGYGVLPKKHWQPEAWTLFLQTESANGVRSSLAPVQILLVFSRGNDNPQTEERQPAELEWLPRPLTLPWLPPEDQRATVDFAHVPMPCAKSENGEINVSRFQFNGSTDFLKYQVHPNGLRCVRFRWNPGPSRGTSYPLALTASYDLLELDIDAHTTATFEDSERLLEALRLRQTVQMQPADDMLLTPGDTLSTVQWEAWYPSHVNRRDNYREIEGAQIKESPWYSWRESILEWPEWPGLTDGDGVRETALHPLLDELIQILQEQTNPKNGLPVYRVSLQTSPPLQPQTLESFLKSTAETADPYGWGILQRFGLTTAFTLQSTSTGEYVLGTELLGVVEEHINSLRAKHLALFPHLHVELLFQAAHSVSLTEGAAVSPDGMLGLIQVSLRPTIRQVEQYYQLRIEGDSQSQIKLSFELKAPLTLIDQADLASGQTYLESKPDEPTIERTVTVPLNGVVNLLMRTTTPPTITLIDESDETPDPTLVSIYSPLTSYFTTNAEKLASEFKLTDSSNLEEEVDPNPLTNQQHKSLHWERFKRYAEALNSTSGGDVRIEVPVTDETAIAKDLPNVMLWAQRFFNAAAVPDEDGITEDGPWIATAYPRTDTPAPATPDESGRLTYDYLISDKWAHTYRYYIRPNHRYELLWESLLKSPSLFPQNGTEPRQQKSAPDLQQGGLDVVLNRIQPLAKPVILSSARLDPPALPGQSVPPGRTWEVIIAQHPEQALIERNQTLARQLQFRQVAFSLLRRFAYTETTGDNWEARIKGLVDRMDPAGTTPLSLKLTPNQAGHQPKSLPGEVVSLDHLDFERMQSLQNIERRAEEFSTLSSYEAKAIAQDIRADIRSLDLPLRLGNFQQGALVLQWDTLPFFYQHQLLVIAQSDHQVSEINRVIHKDFDYRSPLPEATMEGAMLTNFELPESQKVFETPLNVTNLAGMQIRVPLKRLWDSLPEAVKQQWPSEKPTSTLESGQIERSPSALPDLEVTYQITQIFEGNLEVQVETLLEQLEDTPEIYKLRQLGKSFLGSIDSLSAPIDVESEYTLNMHLAPISSTPLLRAYDFSNISDNRLKFDSKAQQLHWLGVLNAADREILHREMIKSIAELKLLQHLSSEAGVSLERYSSRIVRSDAIAPEDKPLSLPNIPGISYVTGITHTLLLLDRAKTVNDQEFSTFADSCDAKLRETLFALQSGDLEEGETSLELGGTVFRDGDFAIAAVPFLTREDLHATSPLTEKIQSFSSSKPELTWTGSLNSEQINAMESLLYNPAVGRLRDLLRSAQVTYPYAPPGPTPSVPSENIEGFSIAINNNDEWILQWMGELTADIVVRIHGLLDDERYQTSAIRLLCKVLAGQRVYVQELHQLYAQRRQEVQDLEDRRQSASGPEKQALSVESIGARQRAIEARFNMDAASATLNRAIAAYETLPSAKSIDNIDVSNVNNFRGTTYEQSIIWRITVPLLQVRLSHVQAGRLISRLNISPESGELTWENLDNLDIFELRNQVSGRLNEDHPIKGDGSIFDDQDSQAILNFLQEFNALIERIEEQQFTFDYRPFQSDLNSAQREYLIIRGKLLHASRSLNEVEQNQLRNRFFDAPSVASLNRFFVDLQDKDAIDSLYERWLVEMYVPQERVQDAIQDLSIASNTKERLAKQLNYFALPAENQYALIWRGAMSNETRDMLRKWGRGLTYPSQIDAVDELLRQVDRKSKEEIIVLAQGEEVDLSPPNLERVRSRLRIDKDTVLLDRGIVPDSAETRYALVWTGLMSEADQATLQNWRSQLTNSAQGDAVDQLLHRGIYQSDTVVLAKGRAPDVESTVLADARSNLSLGRGTILYYHGLMTELEAQALRLVVGDAAAQHLFNQSLLHSLRGGELRIMARRGSATPSQLVTIQPQSLS